MGMYCLADVLKEWKCVLLSTFLVFFCQFSCQFVFSRMEKPILLKMFCQKNRNVFTMVFDSSWQRYCRTKSCDFPSKLHPVSLWSDSWERKTPLFVCQDILGFCNTVCIRCRKNTLIKKGKDSNTYRFLSNVPLFVCQDILGLCNPHYISTIYVYIYTHTYM